MSAREAAAYNLAQAVAEVKELQDAKTRTPPDGLAHILTAPRDGSPFKAALEDGEEVTARFDEGHFHYLGYSRWYDDNGDGAPDGRMRTWHWPEFKGWRQ